METQTLGEHKLADGGFLKIWTGVIALKHGRRLALVVMNCTVRKTSGQHNRMHNDDKSWQVANTSTQILHPFA